MVQAKKWILAHHFDGEPKESDLQLVVETLPDIKDGEVFIEAVYLSVDPYMRPYVGRMLKEGDTMIGSQVAKVVETRNPKFPVGSYVVANVGWRTHTITGDESLLRQMPPFGDLPLSYALGILGMPGMTAYFGLLEICQPKSGEVVLVNGAGGAVGSLVGQIAKIKGCKVIAFAGTPEKCRWLKKDLGIDVVYNYKEVTDQEKAIKEAAPDGINCFFDNVGGPSFTAGMRNMKEFGRVSLCGAISIYNKKDPGEGPYVNWMMIGKQLKMEGFLVHRWVLKWGVNCFFDNVGGPSFTAGMRCMKEFGRVSLCGAISIYNKKDPGQGPYVNWMMIGRQLKMEGFLVHRWIPKWGDAMKEMMDWIKSGKITTRETVTTGFENMRTAFYGLFKGDNIGKAVVKV